MLQIIRSLERRFPQGAGLIVKILLTMVGLGLLLGSALLLNNQ